MTQSDLQGLLERAGEAWLAFVEARTRMNAAIPALEATPAERALYDERYRADHKAEREHWRTAILLAQNSVDLRADLAAKDARVAELERVIAGLNKQLTEQFELSTKYVAIAEQYRAALEPFSEACTISNHDDDESIDDTLAATKITWADIRRARSAYRAARVLHQSPEVKG